MKRFSSTLIGAFVLGALALATVGVISFGAQVWWRETQYIAVYFDQSVYGLDRGSAVRMKGVRIGRVSSINVSYEGGSAVVEVLCEIDRNPLALEDAEEQPDIRDKETLEEMVADGLQARLDLIGITGMLYLELDFLGVPPERSVAVDHPEYVVVPSVPSSLTGLTDNLAEIARQLGAIDFVGIGNSAVQMLDTMHETLEEARVEELFDQLNETVSRVNKVLDSEEMQTTIAAAGKSFEDVSRLAERLDAQVDPLTENLKVTSEDLRETLRDASETFFALQELLGPRLGLGGQLGETFRTIENAARSVERLADYLERNPQAIVRGRAEEQ